MIHNVMILKTNGACLYERKYSDRFTMNTDLTAGLFSAMLAFSNDIGTGDIESMTMKEMQFNFSKFR